MSGSTYLEMACPGCVTDKDDLHDNRLSVSFVGTCEITEQGSEDQGDHEFTPKSHAWCSCGWSGRVQQTHDHFDKLFAKADA